MPLEGPRSVGLNIYIFLNARSNFKDNKDIFDKDNIEN